MSWPARIRSRTAVLGDSMFRLLFTATLGSAIGTYATTIALTADIDTRTHSTWWVALLFVVTFMPRILVVFIGPLIDRLSRKTLIVGSDVVRLAVFAVLPFANHPGTMIVLAAASGIADSFFRPAVFAGVPNLVDEPDLDSATTVLQGTEWVAAAVGPLIAGTLVSLSSAHIVYWLNAATFLFSAILLLRIPRRLLQSERGVSRGHWSDLREGFTAFRTSTPLRVAFFGFGLTMIASGLVNVSEIFLATRSLGSSAGFGYGLLWTGSGVGLVVGSIVTGFLLERHNVLGIYAYAFVPLTVGILGAATAPNIWIAATAMTMTGFGNGLTFPMTILIVQRYTSDRLRGRAFTVIISVHTMLLGLAQALSGALTAGVGARWTYVVAAACTAGSAVVVTSLLRVGDVRPVPREAHA